MTDAPVYKDLDAVMGIGGKVIIEEYLKFAIGMTSMPNNSTISQGCLADLELKNIIETRLKTIQTCDVPVGQQIKVIGEIVCSSNFRSYLLVNDVSHIIQVENGKRKRPLEMIKAKITPSYISPFKRVKLENSQ